MKQMIVVDVTKEVVMYLSTILISLAGEQRNKSAAVSHIVLEKSSRLKHPGVYGSSARHLSWGQGQRRLSKAW